MDGLSLSPTEDDRAFVYAVVRRIVRTDDAANDATQDALLVAHRRRDQFRGDAAYRTWLYRVAVTAALGHLRKQARSREDLATGDHAVGDDVVDGAPSPEEAVAARELLDRVRDELADVPAPYRAVFDRRIDDWSDADIAQEVGISVANVKIRTHRVRQRLRAALGAPAPSAIDRAEREPSMCNVGTAADRSRASRRTAA